MNRNILSIVKKYLDYSQKNLISQLKNLNRIIYLKKDITLDDIFFMCSRKGYIGFYVSNEYINTIKTLKTLKSTLSYIWRQSNSHTYFYIDIDRIKPYYCNLMFTFENEIFEYSDVKN